ncbi:beta-galactosidase family protein [Dyella sp. A6]|uniref:glycoside hydrolase family 35 protein n=1 Tax=Dyella aluminiiresistens TaxID=3069105 RepID=UPI002E772238|nr:beta-galactosidase family protein [Dyella sp. A6]
MLRRVSLSACFALALVAGMAARAATIEPVTIAGDHFVRAGKPYQIIAGSMHFQRVPRAYWRDRLEKARAMGLNTITTYVFWNAVEPRPGHFDFKGRNDVAAFLRLAQAMGLNVILRPGPYACAEWEAGGLPAWLFADPNLHVRTRDPAFLHAVDRYFDALGRQVAPLMASRGGPVIAVQVENEYGSYGNDRRYMEDIRQALKKAGMGSDILFTSDGPGELKNDAMPGVLAVVNFAPGEARKAFAELAAFRPRQPRMAGEYWAGWFDQWGGAHAQTDTSTQAKELAWILGQGDSVNIYMFEGGTSFGFMNGANFQGGPADHYAPQTTSYDYDAALDEGGRPRRKFMLFRDVIERATDKTPPPLPPALPRMRLPIFTLTQSASLWSNLPAPVHVDLPKPMEHFGQAYGYILYRTRLDGPHHGQLYLGDVRDYAAVYIDRQRVGTVDRRLKQVALDIDTGPGRHTLDVLVENTGRINYGPHLADGRAGLVDPVMFDGRVLHGWDVYPLPMRSPRQIHGWSTVPVTGPAFHRGWFDVTQRLDTFLDVRAFGKGFAWVNGHNLGRIWSIGPQHSLYLPAPWMRRGRNDVVVFDLRSDVRPTLRGLDTPLWSTQARRK